VSHLIEVKTDQSTGSLYKAVGQVMWHGALENGGLRRIVVVPGEPSTETVDRLQRLGITTLRYDWSAGRPQSSGLEALVKQ
jgi:hypothetical protein